MKPEMIFPRYLSTCFICLFVAACDTQEAAAPITHPSEITKESPAAAVTKPPEIKKESPETKPLLDLSLDSISINHLNEKDDGLSENEITEKNSALFKALNQGAEESEISVSGKLLMNDNDNNYRDYLDSVDGAQIQLRIKTD
jgi:hypothetical protein